MKKALILIYILLSIVSCKGEPIKYDKINQENISQNRNVNGDTIKITIGNTQLVLHGLSKEDFSYEIKKDTIYLIRKGDVGIDNLQVQILSGTNTKELKGEIDYGVYQYLLDDMIPPRLNFIYKESIQVPIASGKYDLSKEIKNRNELQNIYQEKYFEKLRNESYQFQKSFYQSEVLNKKQRYKDCCPEYIEKAKKFLSKKQNDFKTISELAVEPTYNKIILNLGSSNYLVFNNYLDNVED